MAEQLQMHTAETKKTIEKLALNETPDILMKQKHEALVAGRISDLQSQLPIQNNSAEGKRLYESKDNYSWLRNAIKPFESTPEFTKRKGEFDGLKQGFIATKKQLLDAESTLYSNKAELKALDIKLNFIKQRREELKNVNSSEKDKELNELKEIESKIKPLKTEKFASYNVDKQAADITELEKKLKSGEGAGYEKIIAKINEKPKLVTKHYQSQQTTLLETINIWSNNNKADTSNPEYKKLDDRLNEIKGEIGKLNKTINEKQDQTQKKTRNVLRENEIIANAVTSKYSLFTDYLNTNLLLKSYGGLDKESDRAKASLQHQVYALILNDLGTESLSFMDEFYNAEWSNHLTNEVYFDMDIKSLVYMNDADPQSIGLGGKQVTTSAGNIWKDDLYATIRDFYTSTYNPKISVLEEKDPVGLQQKVQEIKSINSNYKKYKQDNDTLDKSLANITEAEFVAQKYQEYVDKLVSYEVKDQQLQHLSNVSSYVGKEYDVANTNLTKITSASNISKADLKNTEKLINDLNKRYPVIVAIIKNGKTPSKEQIQDFRAYKSQLIEIESQGAQLSQLREQQQTKDANLELAANLGPLASAYTTAANAYKKPEKPSPFVLENALLTTPPLNVSSVEQVVDLASILNYVDSSDTKEKD